MVYLYEPSLQALDVTTVSRSPCSVLFLCPASWPNKLPQSWGHHWCMNLNYQNVQPWSFWARDNTDSLKVVPFPFSIHHSKNAGMRRDDLLAPLEMEKTKFFVYEVQMLLSASGYNYPTPNQNTERSSRDFHSQLIIFLSASAPSPLS